MCSCSIGGRYHLIQKGSQRTDDEMTIRLRDFSGEISVSDSVVSTFTYTVSELQEKVMFLDVQFDGANPLSLKQQWIYMENRLMFGDSDSSTYYLVKIPPLTKRSDAIPDMCKKASSLCYTPYAQLYRKYLSKTPWKDYSFPYYEKLGAYQRVKKKVRLFFNKIGLIRADYYNVK